MARTAVAILLLAGLAGAKGDLAQLVRQLGGDDVTQRSLAYRQLLRRKDPAVVPLLLQAIPGFSPSGRYYGINVIAALPAEVSRPALRKLAASPDRHLRLSAAAQLVRRGERQAVSIVVKVLRGPAVEEAQLALLIQRARFLGSAAVHAALRDLLVPSRSETNLYVLLGALGGEDYDGARDRARALLGDARDGVRAAARSYLLRFGDSRQAAPLAEAIRNGELHSAAFARVRGLLEDADGQDEVVLAAIAERCKEEPNGYLLASMVGFLAKVGYGKAVPMLRELVEHDDVRVSKAAFAALAELSAAPEAGSLERMLLGEDLARALMAARVLRRMDDRRGLPVVLEIVKAGGSVVLRREAVEVLGEFRAAKAIPPLLDALTDADSMIRSQAAQGLLATLRTLYPYRRFDLLAAGYDAYATEAERRAAAQRIRSWWEANRAAGW